MAGDAQAPAVRGIFQPGDTQGKVAGLPARHHLRERVQPGVIFVGGDVLAAVAVVVAVALVGTGVPELWPCSPTLGDLQVLVVCRRETQAARAESRRASPLGELPSAVRLSPGLI